MFAETKQQPQQPQQVQQEIPSLLVSKGWNPDVSEEELQRFLGAVFEDFKGPIAIELVSSYGLESAKASIKDTFDYLRAFDLEKFDGRNGSYLVGLWISFSLKCNIINQELLSNDTQSNEQ